MAFTPTAPPITTNRRFIAGYMYSNDKQSLNYGTNPSTTTQNVQSAKEPIFYWACHSVTKTFITFLNHTNTIRRLKKYKDAIGDFVYPHGRFPGAPVLRASYTYGQDPDSSQQ